MGYNQEINERLKKSAEFEILMIEVNSKLNREIERLNTELSDIHEAFIKSRSENESLSQQLDLKRLKVVELIEVTEKVQAENELLKKQIAEFFLHVINTSVEAQIDRQKESPHGGGDQEGPIA